MRYAIRWFKCKLKPPKKKLLTQGAEKANQVLKRQKALAAVEAATKKQAANKLGRST